jgi:putative spermidine/putrescine transport system permease protein
MHSTAVKPALAIYTALFILFLYAPFFVLGILSFQTGPEGGPQFPIIEWSTYWYRQIFGLTPPSRIAPLPIGPRWYRPCSACFRRRHSATVSAARAWCST